MGSPRPHGADSVVEAGLIPAPSEPSIYASGDAEQSAAAVPGRRPVPAVGSGYRMAVRDKLAAPISAVG
jgi:hypothetical protein